MTIAADTMLHLEAAYDHLDKAIRNLESALRTSPGNAHHASIDHYRSELQQVLEGDGFGTDSGYHDYVGHARQEAGR